MNLPSVRFADCFWIGKILKYNHLLNGGDIMDIKIRCKSCGSFIPSTSKICPVCGKKSNQKFKKKWLLGIVPLLLAGVIGIFSFGSNDDPTPPTTPSASPAISAAVSQEAEQTDDVDQALEAIGAVEVDKNLFSVELTIPSEYVDEGITQESLDATVDEKGFKSATLNDDGSITYIMTKAQHSEMIAEMKENIDQSLDDMIESDDYPSIVDIRTNANYTDFEVILSTDTVTLTESIAVLGFYMYGGLYNIYNGTKADNISVAFINQATGQVIQTANSADMGNDTTTEQPEEQVVETPPVVDPEPVVTPSGGNAGNYIGHVENFVFHATDCHNLPKETNRIYFETRQEAVDYGYRPCGNCKP